jgi:hypothetical protein
MVGTEHSTYFSTFDYTTLPPQRLIIFFSSVEILNIAELDEIRFYAVAPHWYFRPLMGLLVVSPSHYEGLM